MANNKYFKFSITCGDLSHVTLVNALSQFDIRVIGNQKKTSKGFQSIWQLDPNLPYPRIHLVCNRVRMPNSPPYWEILGHIDRQAHGGSSIEEVTGDTSVDLNNLGSDHLEILADNITCVLDETHARIHSYLLESRIRSSRYTYVI